MPNICGRLVKEDGFDNQGCNVAPPLECIEEPEIYSKWKSLPILNISEVARFGHEEMVNMSCQQALEIYSYDERLPPSEVVPPIEWVAYQETDKYFNGSKLRKVTHVRSAPDHELIEHCPRRDFGSRWNARMRALEAIEKDEKGHILASQLCGPIDWYNLAPQTPAVNRNIGCAGHYGWCNLENEIKRFLRSHCGKVVIDVFLNYEDTESVRPKGFKVCAKYLDRNYLATAEWVRYFNNEI